jgi:hypothetical protein
MLLYSLFLTCDIPFVATALFLVAIVASMWDYHKSSSHQVQVNVFLKQITLFWALINTYFKRHLKYFYNWPSIVQFPFNVLHLWLHDHTSCFTVIGNFPIPTGLPHLHADLVCLFIFVVVATSTS